MTDAISPIDQVCDSSRLRDVREAFLHHLDKGVVCQCCARYAQRYWRRYNAGMARSLVELYRLTMEASRPETWPSLEDVVWVSTKPLRKFTGGGGDYAKNCYWGLAEREVRPDGSRGGRMRITRRGAAFVHGDLRIPTHAVEYDGRVDGLTGSWISISDALGTPFDYRELLGRFRVTVDLPAVAEAVVQSFAARPEPSGWRVDRNNQREE